FFGEFSIWTIGGAIVGYAGYNYILFGFLHFLAHADYSGHSHLETRQWTMRPLVIAVAWTGYEYLKSVGFLGYPWGLIAYPLAKENLLAQIAELAGVWGLSFLAAYVNAAIAETFYRSPRSLRDPAAHHLGAVVLLCLLAVGFGAWQRPGVRPRETRSMLLVQQNVDSWEPGRFSDALRRAQELTLHGLAQASASENKPVDAVIWSETALRRPYSPEDSFFFTEPPALPFRRFMQRIGVPLVTGSPQPLDASGDATNSALIITPDGTVLGEYGKQQLVPFAESIPLWHVPAVQRFFREQIGIYGTWVPGDTSDPLPLPLSDGRTLMVGTPICFEDGFGWVPREMVNNGAELLINLTNNSWSRQDSAQTQHFAAARLRSIELRTTLVRGTNSGLSTVVDATGYHRDTLPMFEGTSQVVSVPIYPNRWTLYRAWGDWLGIAAVLLTVGAVFRIWWRSRTPAHRQRN
ncbi:MAG TPA: apolipoprotein N-acyltransferase, partial [Alkalispirochaeta sp.]|nr:apolipoprotein N-acyltransferase [Alkalispirochaeta sp.]